MLRCLFLCLLTLSCLAGAPAAVRAGDDASAPSSLVYMTEDYYPYNYSRNKTVTGLSVDILREMWKRMGVPPQPIGIFPWARAYMLALREPGSVLFSTARTPEREHLFKWAGPIISARFVLIGLKAHHIHMASMEDIRGYSVGVVRQDVTESLMYPFCNKTRVEISASIETNIRKLMLGRLDLIAYEEEGFRLLLEKQGLPPGDFETVFPLSETDVYFAFNNATSSELVSRFQKALDEVRASPEYRKIRTRHLKQSPPH